VPLPPGITALQWLRGQSKNLRSPRTYFSSRAPRGDKDESPKFSSTSATHVQDVDDCDFRAVAGIGAAVLFQDHRKFSKSHWSAIQRYIIHSTTLHSTALLYRAQLYFTPAPTKHNPVHHLQLDGQFFF
jgi:hypothetical protein